MDDRTRPSAPPAHTDQAFGTETDGATPAVAVVIPFRNRGGFLSQTCRSLRNQSLVPWEAILVDDGSGQATRRVACELVAADNRFRLIDVDDSCHVPGPWLARNLGIAAARAPLVAFLDADDLWHPDKLLAQLQLHHGQPTDLSVTSYLRFRLGQNSAVVIEQRTPPAELDFRSLLRGNVLPLSSVMVRRDLLQQLTEAGRGPFRPERHEDYGLWLRLFARFPRLCYRRLSQPLMAYRLHPGSLSAARWHSHRAVSALLAQHSRNRFDHGLMLCRWAMARLAERWPPMISRAWEGGEPLPEEFAQLLRP